MTFYITDGSEESFYTAVFDCYKDREGIITCRGDLQMALDSTFRQITADESKCARVKNKIAEYDLAERGPGDFLPERGGDSRQGGEVRQSGDIHFKLAGLLEDTSLLEAAVNAAKRTLGRGG